MYDNMEIFPYIVRKFRNDHMQYLLPTYDLQGNDIISLNYKKL